MKEEKELKFFYELRSSKGVLIHQSELFTTPEEARENGIDDANGRDFICKGVVYECDSTGGVPLGDESDEDEWTFYGGNEED